MIFENMLIVVLAVGGLALLGTYMFDKRKKTK